MRKHIPYYLVHDKMYAALEPHIVAVRKETDPSILGEPFVSLEEAVAAGSSAVMVMVNELIKDVRMERIAATGMTVGALLALAAAILYFLKLPILSEIVMSWIIVVGVGAAVGFAGNLIIRSIWDSE